MIRDKLLLLSMAPAKLLSWASWVCAACGFVALLLLAGLPDLPWIEREQMIDIVVGLGLISIGLRGFYLLRFPQESLAEERQRSEEAWPSTAQLRSDQEAAYPWFFRPIVRQLWGASLIIFSFVIATTYFALRPL